MTSQLAPGLAGIVATLLMLLAGLTVKQLVLRSERCPVCRRAWNRCTCRLHRWEV